MLNFFPNILNKTLRKMGNKQPTLSPCIETSIRCKEMTPKDLATLVDEAQEANCGRLQAIAWDVFNEFVDLTKNDGKYSVTVPSSDGTQITLSEKGRSAQEEVLHRTKLEECYRAAVEIHARLKSVIDSEKKKSWPSKASSYLEILIALDKCAGLEPKYEIGGFYSDDVGYLKLAEKLGIKSSV